MTVEILAQWSQAGMGGAEDIVRVDLDHPDRPETFARHTPGTTLQYPVVGAGLVGWYRLPVDGNVNTTPEQGTLTLDPQTGQVRFVPAAGFTGTVEVTYTVTDANGLVSAPQVLGAPGSQYVLRGWICTAGGEPGTWVQDRGATGT